LLELAEAALLAQALLVLPLAALALRRWGLAAVQQWLAQHPNPVSLHDSEDPASRRRAERIAWTVQAAAAYGPWPANCLQRSVILWWFLRRRYLDGDLRIGVRRGESGALDFHCWVEYAGQVINDQRDMRSRYATFDQAIVPPGAAFH